MPIAAVPAYLGQDFKDASPGLRFGLLLPIWTTRQDQEAEIRKRAEARSKEGQEISDVLQRQGMDAAIRHLRQSRSRPLPGLWDKNDFAARNAWDSIRALGKADVARMKALSDRQAWLASCVPASHLLRLDALSIAPFTTGLGNEHPLENGFAFLNPYGLPYLPGSGVKGVLRQAARELASGEWGDAHGWDAAHPSPASGRGAGGEGTLSALDALFGRESAAGDTDHLRGALSFWDVIPQIKGDSLMVEIMTPHQSHYYQQARDRKAGDSTSPHDSGAPNPISFLTVPPGSGFAFHVVCDAQHLGRLAPALLADDGDKPRWQTLLTAAFEHAFQWLGFGAKTAVGYGAMKRDADAEAKAKKAKAEREAGEADRLRREVEKQAREEALAKMSPGERLMREFLDARPDKNQTELSALLGGLKQGKFDGEHKIEIARHAEALMRAAKKWKEKSEKKNPDKDNDYQDTLKVMAWLAGK